MSDEADEVFGIAEVAERIGLAPDTLRYFERQGTVPSPQRDHAGRRRYTAADIELIRMLVHLRETGMPLADIARFTGADGGAADPARLRLELLTAHRRRIRERREELDRALDVVSRKIADYDDRSTGTPQRLERPDCALAFDVRGEGPPLFLVGAPAGRAGFAALARELADRFTVVTHDPRGIGESRAATGMAEPTPEVLAEDLAALVDLFTGGPALFVGTSGGAVTLLELVTRHPSLVSRAVLHEPPLVTLLDDAELTSRATAAFAVAERDPQRAVQEFFDLTGAGHRTGPGQTPPPHLPLPELPAGELDKNRYFLGRMAGPTVLYAPDVEALRRAPVALCAGALSHQQLARLATQALADRLGQPLVDMPGNHVGASAEPAEFARAVLPLLRRPDAR
ncbi:DNA-binding transcriptional regulator, MerR family [Streptomyces zhaozhouensis]|uniref:DNA-binding transcriptional regulator, MerR family n=1 Tax=Streptomyces zhaozhouensis TaxID=1300267 RepID=A0A286E049_9ACTN|nr:alpha/beta fold hydrolase [Streptomyces zhaozhouensis]SOD64277.1 DNA-binding transcriptional regulator, MerR family [Streptomyces zhaozhouensis]